MANPERERALTDSAERRSIKDSVIIQSLGQLSTHRVITPENTSPGTASIIKQPTGTASIRQNSGFLSAREKMKDTSFIMLGYVKESQATMQLNSHDIAYVEMNSSGRVFLEKNETGVIATSGLMGCTGVAGFAKNRDGKIQSFVSHYDALSQNGRITRKDSPVNRDLYTFRYQVEKDDTQSTPLYVVSYPASSRYDQDYGKRRGVFREWHYMDQINTTIAQLGKNAQVLLLPYELNSQGHSLASGRMDGKEGIFWDGVYIDFADYIGDTVTNKQ